MQRGEPSPEGQDTLLLTLWLNIAHKHYIIQVLGRNTFKIRVLRALEQQLGAKRRNRYWSLGLKSLIVYRDYIYIYIDYIGAKIGMI